jgi:hypothetical protein
MRMGDDGPFHRTHRVGIRIALAAIKTAGCELQNPVHLAGYFLVVQCATGFLRND